MAIITPAAPHLRPQEGKEAVDKTFTWILLFD